MGQIVILNLFQHDAGLQARYPELVSGSILSFLTGGLLGTMDPETGSG
jgi:hypothetical protein